MRVCLFVLSVLNAVRNYGSEFWMGSHAALIITACFGCLTIKHLHINNVMFVRTEQLKAAQANTADYGKLRMCFVIFFFLQNKK